MPHKMKHVSYVIQLTRRNNNKTNKKEQVVKIIM